VIGCEVVVWWTHSHGKAPKRYPNVVDTHIGIQNSQDFLLLLILFFCAPDSDGGVSHRRE